MKRNGNESWVARTTASHISRRGFLKTAATATGAAVMSPYLGGAQAFGAEAESKVVMGYGLSLVQLDPHRNENTVHESVLRNMYECLVAFSKDLKRLEPQLATEWKRIDNTTMQFKLRQNVKFHNGEEFDGEAVKFSIHRMLEAREIHRTRRTGNYEIRVTDDDGRPIASSQALAYRKGDPLPFLHPPRR